MVPEIIISHPKIHLPIQIPNAERFRLYGHFIEAAYVRLYDVVQKDPTFLSLTACRSILENMAKMFDQMASAALLFADELDVEKFKQAIRPLVDNFVNANIRALERMVHDKDILCKLAFKDKKIEGKDCVLQSVISTDSDPHHHGETVLIGELVNSKGEVAKFVYKPSSILIDMMIVGNIVGLNQCGIDQSVATNLAVETLPRSLIEILNKLKSDSPQIANYLICPRIDQRISNGNPHDLSTHYGYMEYLPHNLPEHNQSDDPAVHALYSEHAGVIAASATVCCMHDTHCQNLMISQLLLNLIDLENSLLPSPPDPVRSLLFEKDVGGFYGILEGMANRLYTTNAETIRINPEDYKRGVVRVMDLFSDINSAEIRAWLNHQIMEIMPIRVVTMETGYFKVERNNIIISKYLKDSRTEEVLFELTKQSEEMQLRGQQLFQLKSDPGNALTDEGIPQAIMYGDHNARIMFDCYREGDIPVHHMFVLTRHLLGPDHRPIILPGAKNPLNYFLHTPHQAMQNRVVILQENLQYREFIRDYLQLLINYINASEDENNKIVAIIDCYRRAVDIIYQLLDYNRELSTLPDSAERSISQDLSDMIVLAERLMRFCKLLNTLISSGEEGEMVNDAFSAALNSSNKLLDKYAPVYQQQVLSQVPNMLRVSVDQSHPKVVSREIGSRRDSGVGGEGDENALLRHQLILRLAKALCENVQYAQEFRNFISREQRPAMVDERVFVLLKDVVTRIELPRGSSDQPDANLTQRVENHLSSQLLLSNVSNQALQKSCDALLEAEIPQHGNVIFKLNAALLRDLSPKQTSLRMSGQAAITKEPAPPNSKIDQQLPHPKK